MKQADHPVQGSRRSLPVIALTLGEPAGIGPDVALMAAQRTFAARVVMIADRHMLVARASQLRLPLELGAPEGGAGWSLEHLPLAIPCRPGVLEPGNARSVLATVEHAVAGCINGRYDALVTGPVHKGVINDSGIVFTGHTEFLASQAGVGRVVMMLVGSGLRVALVTTHLPLAQVPAAITRELLAKTLRILLSDLVRRFGIAAPRILVAGLNPHAGESGHLGREEIEIIGPVLDMLRAEGFLLEGPLPADTLFQRDRLAGADCVLAMYHDQGLPVLKYASFGGGVNVTLGLPFVRTSVDHGSAVELAGTGRAHAGSLVAAIDLAIELVLREQAARGARIG